MRTIYKYEIPIMDKFTYSLPIDSEVVFVAIQNNVPTMWIEHYTTAEYIEHTFYVEGTGHEIVPNAKHVGSFIQRQFVWHLYKGF